MTPPPSGLESTPARGFPVLITCPHCGKVIPPIALPAASHGALKPKPGTAVNRAPELDPTPAQPDKRLADTERMDRPGER